MKQKTTMFRKASASLLGAALVFELLIPVRSYALFGGGPKIPSASSVAKTIEQRYHINTEAVQNLGETLNVADNKKTTPEVSIFFSPTDPKEGQSISAKAFPMYFSNPSEQLYYTWYLKRSECDKDGSVSSSASNKWCDSDDDGDIDENDWKVAAAKIIATDGVSEGTSYAYGADTDSDGYRAEYGGGQSANTSGDYCYVKNSSTGELFEIIKDWAQAPSFDGCSSGVAACISGSDSIDPGEITATADPVSASVTGDTFQYGSEYEYVSAASCKNGQAVCPSGTRTACVSGTDYTLTCAAGETCTLPSTLSSCTEGTLNSGDTGCSFHMFPKPGSGTSGDGSFGASEEEFWGTNPRDPDTADNGNKDEANIVGLGQDTFKWNYQAGDQVGLAVEGTSMIPTKHEDSSNMIMWAFSRGDCSFSSDSYYEKNIKGYMVKIPAIVVDREDIDACMEDNLVDPLESGLTAKKLEVSVSATPESPVNDASVEKMGDTVVAYASMDNSSRPPSEVVYDWKVFLSNNPNGNWADATATLKNAGLLPETTVGNGLDRLSLRLNMSNDFLANQEFRLRSVDPIYLKMQVAATEHFASGISRNGNGSVVVRVANTTNKIVAYGTGVDSLGKVTIGSPICDAFFPNPTTGSQISENLNRIACRVAKNEIVGLSLENDSEFSNLQWTLNGRSLSCSSDVSSNCGKSVFFAVAGNPGETYSVKVTAVDTGASSGGDGKTLSLTRTFQIVEPDVAIETTDQSSLWPKYLGSYKDLTGSTFDDFSKVAFEKFDAGNIRLKAGFIPGFMKNVASCIWMVDGERVSESCDGIDYAPTIAKPTGGVYNVSFHATLVQPNEKRLALKNIWGIDAMRSAESRLSSSVQVEVVESEEIAAGSKKFFAMLSSYLPASVLFFFKIVATTGLLLFTVGFVFALLPAEPRPDEVILSRRRG